MAKPPGISEFLRAFTAQWFIWMSGAVGVPLTILGPFASNDLAKLGLLGTGVAALIVSAFTLWRNERILKDGALEKLAETESAANALELIFDQHDVRCVRDEPYPLHGGFKSRHWRLLVKNNSPNRTLNGVTVFARNSQFVSVAFPMIRIKINGVRFKDAMLRMPSRLDPGAVETVEMFQSGKAPTNPNDILANKNEFVVEAHAKDTRTIVATFEYDPSGEIPIIRRLS
jgi:hypothetical protein